MKQANPSWQAHLACYAKADDFYRGGKLLFATRYFRNALLLAPGDLDTLWALGDCYSDRGKPWKAEHFYRRALANAPWKKRGDLRYNIANALLDQRRPSAAIRLYQLVPRSAMAYGLARQNERRARELLARKPTHRAARL